MLLKNAPCKLCYIQKCSAEIFKSLALGKNFGEKLSGFQFGRDPVT